MLQAINEGIDTIQGAKSTFVKTFVTDKQIQESLQSFVDTQTTFTKQAVKSMFDVGQTMVNQAVDYDYAKKFFSFK